MSSTSANIDVGAGCNIADDTDVEVVNANLCLTLSRAFSSPAAMNPDDAVRLQQLVPELPIAWQSAASSLAEEWSQARDQPQEFVLAYARLFLGPFEIMASPYASSYMEPDQQLMGPVSQAVAEAYAEATLEPGPGPREAPDHVSLEWECMYFLTHQYVVTGEEHWIQKRRRFALDHLKPWMPKFSEAIKQADAHPFYNALAAFLSNVVTDSEMLQS